MRTSTVGRMGIAAVVMAASVLVSRLMGLVRDKVVSWQFGAGSESDVYFAAFVVPDLINHFLAGGYIAIVLIPMLAESFASDEDEGWRFLGTVLSWALLLSVALTWVAFICAPSLSSLVAPGFTDAQLARLSLFLRIILPAQVFFVVGSCLMAILYLRKCFVVPALAPLLYNGAIIAGGLLLPFDGMEGYCWGVLAGAFLGAFALPLAAVCHGGFRLRPGLAHARLGRLLLLALPLMVGVSITVMDEQLVRVFGSMAGEGAVSLLNYARRVMMVPVGVVAQAAGVASFPFLASLAAKGDDAGFDETVRRALRASMHVVVPLTACMAAVAEPTLGLLFEGGRFSARDTALAAPLLRTMLLAVPFWTIHQIVSRAFYARQDTLTPAVVGTMTTAAVLVVYPLAVANLGAAGAAACATCSMAAYTVCLCLAWRFRAGGTVFGGILGVVARPAAPAVAACFAACAAPGMADGAVACASLRIAEAVGTSPPLAAHVCEGAVGCVVFIFIYAGYALLCHPELLIFRRRTEKEHLCTKEF